MDRDKFAIGEYIVYVNGDRYEIGRVKSLRDDGAFVYYHEGDTAAKTPYDRMHKLVNQHCIKKSTLGGATMMEQSDVKTISYQDYQNALRKMWIDNILTSGEYIRISDRLSAIQEEKDVD